MNNKGSLEVAMLVFGAVLIFTGAFKYHQGEWGQKEEVDVMQPVCGNSGMLVDGVCKPFTGR